MHSPVLHQNELLQHSNSDAKPGECSIFTAVAGMSSRWVEPIWESYWLQGKAAPWQALGELPRFSSLATLLGEHRALNSSKIIGKLFPLPRDSGPPHTRETQKVNYSWSSLMPDKSTWDFHGYQSRLHLFCCVFFILLISEMLRNLLWRVKNLPI